MHGLGKKVLSVLVFVAAFVVVKYGFDAYQRYKTQANVEASMAKLKADGVKNNPNLPVSEAMGREAVAKTSEQLSAEGDEKTRRARAASSYFGFYLVNTRTRPEFCRQQNVDITPFVSAFEREHKAESAQARAALAAVDTDENQLFGLVEKQLKQVIVQDMNDIAASNKVSVREACQMIASNGETVAAEMHISKVQPAVYRTLTTGRP
ncbi:MAG: hypothetical protein ACJ8NR_04595 [Sulfurifustis sp.]